MTIAMLEFFIKNGAVLMVKRAAYQKHFVVCHIIYKNIPSYLKVHLALNHFSVESTTFTVDCIKPCSSCRFLFCLLRICQNKVLNVRSKHHVSYFRSWKLRNKWKSNSYYKVDLLYRKWITIRIRSLFWRNRVTICLMVLTTCKTEGRSNYTCIILGRPML